MAQQLLWLEMLLRLSAGAVLLVLPLTAARILGLPVPQALLWPRLLGALLVGMAAAILLEGSGATASGLGPGGLVVINLVTAGTLITLLVLDRACQTRRGKIFLWTLALLFVGLGILEIGVV